MPRHWHDMTLNFNLVGGARMSCKANSQWRVDTLTGHMAGEPALQALARRLLPAGTPVKVFLMIDDKYVPDDAMVLTLKDEVVDIVLALH